MKLEIRPDLQIEIHTVPGSGRIRTQLPDAPHCMFDPTDGSWHPYGAGAPKEILSHVAPSDLRLIEARLQQYSEERAGRIAVFNEGNSPVKP